MQQLLHLPVAAIDPHRFASVATRDDYEALLTLIDRAAAELRGRVLWNINSTASGGGVVELLRPLLGYCRGGGVDARWAVIAASPSFFRVTKRLHNHLHGFDGDGGTFSGGDQMLYEATLADDAAQLTSLVREDDIVILHDPQTAGLVDAMNGVGAAVIWRCHVGLDHPNALARGAWDFLRPYIRNADAYVFSRPSFAWEGLEQRKICVIHPRSMPSAPRTRLRPETKCSRSCRAAASSRATSTTRRSRAATAHPAGSTKERRCTRQPSLRRAAG